MIAWKYSTHGNFRCYDTCPYIESGITSNKEPMTPQEPKCEPEYMKGSGWYKGYSFKRFWGNVYALLGEIAELDGIQQLCHHYYLQNGSISARETARRIRLFLNPAQP